MAPLRASGDAHIAADDLQRCADGRLEAGRDAAILAHLETCERCRAEVERLRRASASFALSSTPPADLLARIKARRAAGERVELPVDEVSTDDVDVTTARDGHPALLDLHRIADGDFHAESDAQLVAHVRTCVMCRREIEDARRVTAALSLLSHPPNELFDRIRARRAAGERVILPSDAAAAKQHVAQRRGRRLQPWGLAIAASLVLAIGIGREVWKRTVQLGPGIDSLRVTTTLRNAADSAGRLLPTLDPDTRGAHWRELTMSLEGLHSQFAGTTAPRSSTDSLTIGLLEEVFDGSGFTSTARRGMQALGEILARRPEYQVAVVTRLAHLPGDEATELWALRQRAIRDALLRAGVSPDRLTLSIAKGERTDLARIEVIVLAPRPAPEIR